ncbi:hypothetical protein GRH70_05285 [Pseudomonas aeruginosa]|nr:hypothetical protein [Pseudomonas aeruginosa]
MTDYASLLFDSVARLRKAATTEAVCREMVEFAARLGFDRVIVCSLFPRPGEDELIDELFFVHGDWAEGRSAQQRDAYLLHCPVTRHILELDEPFFWSKCSGQPIPDSGLSFSSATAGGNPSLN